MLAKILCTMNKPNKQTYLSFENSQQFMQKLEVAQIPGVGKVNSQVLSGMGIRTCEELSRHAFDVKLCFTEN